MILFDGHVHIYDCYEFDTFIEAAYRNFQKVVTDNLIKSDCSCFLLLAEANGLNYFENLKDLSKSGGSNNNSDWSVESTREAESLLVHHSNYPGLQLYICAGRQIKSAEGLELLALLTGDSFDDGLSFDDGVQAIIQSGGLAVCPWGAGKWLGKRGKLLSAYLEEEPPERFFIGDSGGRPSFWSRSGLCDRTELRAKLISGSDPLPLSGDVGRAGSFGGIIESTIAANDPAESLRNCFLDQDIVVTGYGVGTSTVSFITNQVLLRTR